MDRKRKLLLFWVGAIAALAMAVVTLARPAFAEESCNSGWMGGGPNRRDCSCYCLYYDQYEDDYFQPLLCGMITDSNYPNTTQTGTAWSKVYSTGAWPWARIRSKATCWYDAEHSVTKTGSWSPWVRETDGSTYSRVDCPAGYVANSLWCNLEGFCPHHYIE